MTGRVCGACGADGLEPFTDASFTVSHDGMREEVHGLSGHRCTACGDILFDPQSALRYAEAGDALIRNARRRQGEELRRIRKKLKLTQREAAELTGGGHNAFSRYERGEVEPVRAVVTLFRLFDRHPDLVDELR